MSSPVTATVGLNDHSLQVIANATMQLIVKVLDVQGHFITTVKRTLDEGIHESCFNLDELAEGSYVVNAFNGDRFMHSFHYVRTTTC